MLIEGPPRIVVDPWRGAADRAQADIVLITDPRFDHASPEDIDGARRAGARLLAPRSVAFGPSWDTPIAAGERDSPRRRRAGLWPVFPDLWPTSEGERIGAVPLGVAALEVAPGTFSVRTLPAAAPPRARGFLERGTGVTYVVESGDARWLFLGASDALPEHEGLSPGVAFFAVGGFTMPTPEEAADAAARVRPRLAVPTHWGDLSARYVAAGRFIALCRERGIEAAAVGPGQAGRA